MNELLSGIVSGFISGITTGLILYRVQRHNEKKEKKLEQLEANRLGHKTQKYIDRDFLTTYQPGDISIEKIISDLGPPLDKFEDNTDNNINQLYEFTVYKYKFKNAIVLFTTLKGESSIISVTVSHTSLQHPIVCPMSPAEDKVDYIGNALVTQEIIDNSYTNWSEMFRNWSYSAIQAKFFYNHLKHLTFTYVIYDHLDNSDKSMFLNKQIEQVCVSSLDCINPINNYYEYV